MAETYTSNLELVKPDYDSPADIFVINSNMDKIDNAVANAGKVQSVNGQTGAVNLSASDVGALPLNGTAADSAKLAGKEPSHYENKITSITANGQAVQPDENGAVNLGTIGRSNLEINDETPSETGVYSSKKVEDVVSQLSQQKANLAGWTPNKIVGTDDVGNLVAQDPPEGSGGDADTLGGVPAEEYAQKILISDAYDPTKETYVAGDYCVYGNKLYKRKIDASGAEPIFLPDNWKEVNLVTELRSISTPNYGLNALVIPPGTSILQFPSFADNYSVRFAIVDKSSDIVDWDTNMPNVNYANIMINRYGVTCMSVFFGCDPTTGEPVVVMVANVANSLIKWKRII